MPRLKTAQEDVVFRGSFCNRTVVTQPLQVVNAGAGSPGYSVQVCDSLTTCNPVAGISVDSGSTPGTLQVKADSSILQNLTGTQVAWLNILSNDAINYPTDMTGVGANPTLAARVRLLINNREPDQRGTFVDMQNVVDLLADPVRDRYYVLRQDKNQVLVFDGTSNSQVARLRTGNTPTQMAITFDRKYLMVGHENSQIATVYDLDTLEKLAPIVFPGGHYPRSIAASG